MIWALTWAFLVVSTELPSAIPQTKEVYSRDNNKNTPFLYCCKYNMMWYAHCNTLVTHTPSHGWTDDIPRTMNLTEWFHDWGTI